MVLCLICVSLVGLLVTAYLEYIGVGMLNESGYSTLSSCSLIKKTCLRLVGYINKHSLKLVKVSNQV